MFTAAIMLVVLLGAYAFISRPASSSQQQPKQAVAQLSDGGPQFGPRSASMRQLQLEEEADALATVYRNRATEVWHDELKAKASQLFADPTV